MKNQDANLVEIINIRVIRQLVSKDELKTFEKEESKEATSHKADENFASPKKAAHCDTTRKREFSPRIWTSVPCPLNLSSNIRFYRLLKNFTTSTLARLSEVPISTIWNYERGKNKFVRRHTLNKIAYILDVTAADLLKVA